MNGRIFIVILLLLSGMMGLAQIGGDYNPSNPADPDAQPQEYFLNLEVAPKGSGRIDKSSERYAAGSIVYITATPYSNYSFKCWMVGDSVVSTDTKLQYVMPTRNVELTAWFEYDPTLPSEPNDNNFNWETGELIIDNFSSGSLSRAINATLNTFGAKKTDVKEMIVSGNMKEEDYNAVAGFKNCYLYDLSRVTGVSRVPYNTFNKFNAQKVYLPETIEYIGESAFSECSQLSEITIYAMTPPVLGSYVFKDVPDGLVIYVPAAALTKYEESEGWKNLTLLPIRENISNISVSLPEGSSPADFAGMWLELGNVKNGQRIHYVMTDRRQYTFTNVINNTIWNVVLRNERGDVFGQIANVEVKGEDVSVVFPELSAPRNVRLYVLAPDGLDVTDQTQITWTGSKGNYLAQGSALSGLPVGYQATCRITLPEVLAMQYVVPDLMEYVVREADNNIVLRLEPIECIEISGKVKDASTGLPLSGVTVSASQTFAGKYIKTLNVRTDSKGEYLLSIASVPTSLAYAAPEYVSSTIECDSLIAGEVSFQLPDVTMDPITGITISLDLTYTDVSGEQHDWYGDYQNLDFALFNLTQGQAVSRYSVQYPQIVLLEDAAEGDVLLLTTTSRTGGFMPVESTTIVDGQKCVAFIDIIENGQIQASFENSDNASVVGSLYDASDKLVKTYIYINSRITIPDLADGKYTLVTMGGSEMFNSIYDLTQMPNIGLVQGVDYVSSRVDVKRGETSIVNIGRVPQLNEGKFSYTGDNTSFTVNKPNIVVGNYLTLTGRVDFKPAYADDVDNVCLIIDLPESCRFVDNSVMVGDNVSVFNLEGDRLSIPMEQFSDRVRFCVIPTLGGDYTLSAFVQFDLNGETFLQPIGSDNYTAENLSISVPSSISKSQIPVSGTSIGLSNVEIYDNDVLIGQTSSLATGAWTIVCELEEPYNLSTHNIYAKVTTQTGLELQSEVMECVYDMNIIEAKTVTMSFYNEWLKKNVEVIFDLQSKTTDSPSYQFYGGAYFTFVADLTDNDTTKVSDVIIRIYTSKNNWRNLSATYDANVDRWVAVDYFSGNELPVGLDVVLEEMHEQIADRKKIEEDLAIIDSSYSEFAAAMNEIEALLSGNTDEELPEECRILNEFLEDENYDPEKVNSWIESIKYYHDSDDSISDELADELTILYQKEMEEFSDRLKNSQDSSIYALMYLPKNYELMAPSADDAFFEQNGYRYEKKKWIPTNIDNLTNEGFSYFSLTDSSRVWFKYEDLSVIIIDTSSEVEYSMIPVDKDMAKSRSIIQNSVSYSTFMRCVADWGKIGANLGKYYALDPKLDLNSSLTISGNLCEAIESLIEASTCFYREYYTEFSGRVDKDYENLVEDIDEKIENRKRLIDKHNKRIEEKNIKISNLDNDIKDYNRQIKDLEGQVKKTKDPDIIKDLNKQIEEKRNLIKIDKNRKEIIKEEIDFINKKNLPSLKKDLKKLDGYKQAAKDGYKVSKKTAEKIPRKLAKHGKVPVGTKLLKFAGPLGVLADVIDIVATARDAYEEISAWRDLTEAMLRNLPCEEDKVKAEALSADIISKKFDVCVTYASILGSKAAAASLNTFSVPLISIQWWISAGFTIYAEWMDYFVMAEEYVPLKYKFMKRMKQLKCNKDKNDTCPKCGRKPCVCKSPRPRITPIHDPSGYVYEGVSSNRLEGVTATCFYKEEVEDMYGDLHEEIVKWDAEEYAQENPLFTDENGMYAWDVPIGLWQVKFEKEGYETAYSEWLPVPPPQLEVNIGMRQNRQPEVRGARAYEDAVEVEFDKYMMPESLTPENIFVMQNGKPVDGKVELLNEETAYGNSQATFASKVRFNATRPFEADEVTLLVNNRVKSYAGVRMQDDYRQTFTVEQEIRRIVCDSMTSVGYGEMKSIIVSVLPASASRGKTLSVDGSSSMILSVDAAKVMIGDGGMAEILVSGELPGTAALTFTVDGTDKTAMTIVNVKQAEAGTVANPKSNIASGTIVEKGTEIVLSCDTEGAAIYYTLDGSCPCDDTDSRKIYDDSPIVINADTRIKAMAVAAGMYDSDVVELTYYVDDSGIGNVESDEPFEIYPLTVHDLVNVRAGGEIIKRVVISSVNGLTVAVSAKEDTEITMDVRNVPTGVYIVSITTEKGTHHRKIRKVS